jgi:hypothetical protein
MRVISPLLRPSNASLSNRGVYVGDYKQKMLDSVAQYLALCSSGLSR